MCRGGNTVTLCFTVVCKKYWRFREPHIFTERHIFFKNKLLTLSLEIECTKLILSIMGVNEFKEIKKFFVKKG